MSDEINKYEDILEEFERCLDGQCTAADGAKWVWFHHAKLIIQEALADNKASELNSINEQIKKQRGKMSETISRYKAKYGDLDE